MFEDHDLRVMLLAYIDGDPLARKVAVDLLDEGGDPRAQVLRDEPIAWDLLAAHLSEEVSNVEMTFLEANRMRFYIECARYGSPTRPDVVGAVREARRAMVRKLFPELGL